MDDLKQLLVFVPDDTSVLGLFYLRETNRNGYSYNSMDTASFVLEGIDAINLETNETYKLDENGELILHTSDAYVSEEELRERDELDREIEELDRELAELEQAIALQEAQAQATGSEDVSDVID